MECALKAFIVRNVELTGSLFDDKKEATQLLDNFFVHDLGRLLKAAKLEADFGMARGANPALEDFWQTVTTLEILESLKAGMPAQIEVLDKKVNTGKGEAVRSGLLRAIQSGAPYVGFWDADLATPLNAIGDLLGVLLSQPEVNIVLGSRVRLLGRNIERRAARHYLGRIFATCVSLVLDLPVYDTQCGAKLFRVTPEIQQVFQEPFSSRWIFDVELLARYVTLNGLASCVAFTSSRSTAGAMFQVPGCGRVIFFVPPENLPTSDGVISALKRGSPRRDRVPIPCRRSTPAIDEPALPALSTSATHTPTIPEGILFRTTTIRRIRYL